MATARFKAERAGQEYFFCCAGCLAKFQADPAGVLASGPKGMGSGVVGSGKVGSGAPGGLVSIGIAPSSKPAAPYLSKQYLSKQYLSKQRDARAYVCPMCAEVRQIGPGPCPKCGMALEPEFPAPTATKTEYTCPMHPEVVRTEPGSCPICGMALEPRTVTLQEDNPELRDMTRRFWISLMLTAPLPAIAMGSMLSPHTFMAATGNWGLAWLGLLLATPVVVWGGWPFFERGWASVVNRSPNMFTLIAMGDGVAYLFSLVATLFPRIFPPSFRTMGGRPDV